MEKTFGDRLKALRASKGWSQAYLGSKLLYEGKKVPGKTLGNWERGDRRVPPEIITQLSKIFNVSNDYLLGRDVPQWATTDDIFKLNSVLNNSKLTLEYEGKIISAEDRDNLKDMIAFYFWQKEAKERGGKIIDDVRNNNPDLNN